MFDLLDTAISSLESFVESLDPESLTGEESLAALERFCRAEKLCAAGKALASRQVAASNAWFGSLERSPAHLVAKASGSPVGRAASVLETAEVLKQLPGTERAFRAGRLSESQVIEVASAVAMDAGSETDLLEAAEYEAFANLQRQCSRVRGAAMDEQQKHHRAHRRRNLKHWVDPEGVFHLEAKMTTKAGAVVMAAIEPFRRQVLNRPAGRSKSKSKVSDGAVLADALVEMAERSRCGGGAGRTCPHAMVHVRVDLDALIRGYTLPGEICEVPEVGPIPVASAQELMIDSFLNAILLQAKDITGVAHLGRTIPSHLRTALDERDLVCAISGCDKMCCLEYDHLLRDYVKGGPASMANMAKLCHWHHYLKTYHHYRPERVKGRLILVPPDEFGPRPEQSVLGDRYSAHSGVFVVQKKAIREVAGTAPRKKKRSNWNTRPRGDQDPNDPAQRPF